MEANELMSDAVYVVSPHDSIAQARNLFIRHKISTVLVVDGGKPVGMIDEQSLTDAFLKSREPVDSIRVEKVMKHTIVKVGPAASAEEVAKALVQKNAHAAIVYDKEVLGIITKTDLTRHFAKNYSGKARVSDLMRKNPKAVKRQHSIFHAIKLMENSGYEQLVVMDPKMAGIISQKDIAFSSMGAHPRKVVRSNRQTFFVPFVVEDLMRPEVVTIPARSDAAAAAKVMLSKRIGSVVAVSSGNKVEGIITKSDVTRYLASRVV